MKIEIDQSGRIEYTSVDTALGDSLGNSIIMKAKDKRLIQDLYRQVGKPRLFMIELFSYLIGLLIAKSYKKENFYVIDIEYPSHDKNIIHNLTRFCTKLKVPLIKDQIRFGLIGKKSKAHESAYLTFKGIIKLKPVRVTKTIKILFPKKMDRVLVSV